jgi:predicted ester cyclase
MTILAMAAVAAVALAANAASKGADTVQEKNKAVVKRFEEEFKNKANLNIVDELMAPDFQHQLPFPGVPPGREGLKGVGANIFQAFAHDKLHVNVELCVAADDYVITRTRVKAVHTGPFNGIPATGKEVGWTENTIYRLKDGKIVEMIGEGNFLGLMAQLGALPPPPQPQQRPQAAANPR